MPTNPNPSANLFLFYGEDDFSLKRKLDHWKVEFAKKYSPQAVIFLDAYFIYLSIKLLRTKNPVVAMSVFKYSIIYLFLLFIALLVDHYFLIN